MERNVTLRVNKGVFISTWWRESLLLITLFFTVGLFSRVPFQSSTLYHWDSVNFALATQTFDLRIDQPHPPGYILYVLLGKAMNVVTGDPQTSFVWLSVLFSGLSAPVLYLLGSRLFSHQAGILAAAFLVSSPLFWFYGEVALPHVLDAFLVIAIVLLLYQVEQGKTGFVLPAAFALGMATGLRQQTAVFLLPLALYSFRNIGLRRFVLAAVCAGLMAALWLVPLLWLSGGISEYLRLTSAFSSRFLYFDATTLLVQGDGSALLRNINRLARYTAYGLSLAAIPLAVYVVKNAGESLSSLKKARGLFVLFWVAPSLLFYLFVHMGQQGLVFVYLPALFLVSAEALVQLAGVRRSQLVLWATLGIVVLNSYLFVLAPEYLLGGEQVKVLNRSTILNQDASLKQMVRVVRADFSPGDTILVAAEWRQVEYYLPEYEVFRLPLSVEEELGSGEAGNSLSLAPALRAARSKAANVVYIGRNPPAVKGLSFEALNSRSGLVLYYLRQTDS